MSRSGNYIKQLRGYKAFIPTPLPPEPALVLSNDLMKLHEHASLALARLDGLAHNLPNGDLFIAMYVRKEALMSSQIEGTQASLDNIFEYEMGVHIDNINDVKEVVNYAKALNFGIERLDTLPMSLRLIKELHGVLLENALDSTKTPGEFRRSQNWIGGRGSTLLNAIFVPPPAEEALKALSDLENFLHEPSPYPELINCALLHYQFETIHPFLDGNGRVGRLLITLHLHWKRLIEKPIFYPSYYFKQHRQEYYDRLMMVRTSGNYEQWVEFFLKAVIEASESAAENTKKILALQSKDQEFLWSQGVSSPLATMLLNKLFYTPMVTIKDVETHFNVSYPTASSLIKQFVKIGILKEVSGQKRDKRFVYAAYMDILSEGTASLDYP